MLSDDVKKFIARRFEISQRREALALLETAIIHDGSAADDRLLRCAVVASDGSIEKLRRQIESLKHDFRDVIVEGEYTPIGRELVRLRNLYEPISNDDGD